MRLGVSASTAENISYSGLGVREVVCINFKLML